MSANYEILMIQPKKMLDRGAKTHKKTEFSHTYRVAWWTLNGFFIRSIILKINDLTKDVVIEYVSYSEEYFFLFLGMRRKKRNV